MSIYALASRIFYSYHFFSKSILTIKVLLIGRFRATFIDFISAAISVLLLASPLARLPACLFLYPPTAVLSNVFDYPYATKTDLPQTLDYARIYIYYFFHSFQFVVNNLGKDGNSAEQNNGRGHATAQFAALVMLFSSFTDL